MSEFAGGFTSRKRPPSPRSSVLIIDDIYTTGATVNAAIQAFKLRKIKVAGVVALATTASPKSSPRSLSSMG
ncbi:ComF family protein [Limnospira platensis]|uniref:ComF family protein n=1 Tax=Limnospira platensis TaxID=118562 RepID=UPI0021AA8A82